MQRDPSTTSGTYSFRTDGRGTPLTREKPQRRSDRANSHWCEAIGARRYCLKENCGYCGDKEGRR
ncbi:hypothetical protein [Halobellus inordinatus]|uniref:hypothetical protein n=1 Tax=Halobellus inordinatus TaxID=1126236 RepID=UPI002113BEE6|nr:hypothetical protein [Halobellus ramosii]